MHEFMRNIQSSNGGQFPYIELCHETQVRNILESLSALAFSCFLAISNDLNSAHIFERKYFQDSL